MQPSSTWYPKVCLGEKGIYSIHLRKQRANVVVSISLVSTKTDQNLSSEECAIGEPWRQNWERSTLLAHKGGSGGSMSPYAFIILHSMVSHRSKLFHDRIRNFQRFQIRRERIHHINRVISIVTWSLTRPLGLAQKWSPSQKRHHLQFRVLCPQLLECHAWVPQQQMGAFKNSMLRWCRINSLQWIQDLQYGMPV